MNYLTDRQRYQVNTAPRYLRNRLAASYRQQNINERPILSIPRRPVMTYGPTNGNIPSFRTMVRPTTNTALRYGRMTPYQFYNNNAINNRILNRNYNTLSNNPNNNSLGQNIRTGNYNNGGLVNNSIAQSISTFAPTANGFSLQNSGERNVTFAKEFVGGFLIKEQDNTTFNTFQLSTHPAMNATTVAVSNLYQRYKILSYQFKFKAACSTMTTGMHYTGVDYGNQSNLPANFAEAESLEHFTVGPIWQDSQQWHVLKMSNLKERWFSTTAQSSDPESRPARIIYGAMGVPREVNGTLGAIEVKVTYLFNGLGQNFTAPPPSKITSDLNTRLAGFSVSPPRLQVWDTNELIQNNPEQQEGNTDNEYEITDESFNN